MEMTDAGLKGLSIQEITVSYDFIYKQQFTSLCGSKCHGDVLCYRAVILDQAKTFLTVFEGVNSFYRNHRQTVPYERWNLSSWKTYLIALLFHRYATKVDNVSAGCDMRRPTGRRANGCNECIDKAGSSWVITRQRPAMKKVESRNVDAGWLVSDDVI